MSCNEVGKLAVDIVQDFAPQSVEVNAASAQHGNRVLILSERQQQVLERRIFVSALIGVTEGPMQRLFEIARQHACLSFLASLFPACTAADAGAAWRNP